MSKTTLNFILDTFLLMLFLALAWTFAVFRFVFPPPTTAHGWMLWGYSYDAWASVQFVLFCVFAAAILRLRRRIGLAVPWTVTLSSGAVNVVCFDSGTPSALLMAAALALNFSRTSGETWPMMSCMT